MIDHPYEEEKRMPFNVRLPSSWKPGVTGEIYNKQRRACSSSHRPTLSRLKCLGAAQTTENCSSCQARLPSELWQIEGRPRMGVSPLTLTRVTASR